MKKVVFALLVVLTMAMRVVYAQETLTISTYYPSPYGSYNELQTNRLAVGDTDGDGVFTDADQPTRDGDIRLKPQPNPTGSWPAGATGQVTYSLADRAIYHYDGAQWIGPWISGMHCGVVAFFADGSQANQAVRCFGYTPSRAPVPCTTPPCGCPTGFTLAGGDYDSDGSHDRYFFTCVKN